MEKVFIAKYGSIYEKETCFCINNLGVVVDKTVGLIKYGDCSYNFLENWYENAIEKYKKVGFNDVANDIILYKFDRYNGALTIDEICTFLNYMVQVSSNGERIFQMLNKDINLLKEDLKGLAELGF